MNKKTIIISSSVFLIGIIATLILSSMQLNDIEGIEIDTTFNEIENDLEELKEIENSIYELTEQKQVWNNYMYINKENPLEKYHSQENTVNYMMATAMLEEVDFFMESFLVEPFSKALFSNENPNKNEVVKEFMNDITRDKSVTAVGYKVQTGGFNTPTHKADVLFQYEDGLEVELELSFQIIDGGHHSEEEHSSLHVIETSVLDIIEEIKSTESKK